jgi:hypothetical protein
MLVHPIGLAFFYYSKVKKKNKKEEEEEEEEANILLIGPLYDMSILYNSIRKKHIPYTSTHFRVHIHSVYIPTDLIFFRKLAAITLSMHMHICQLTACCEYFD